MIFNTINKFETKSYLFFFFNNEYNIQGVSEIRVAILTSERTRQFMKLFSITFCKIRKSIPRFLPPNFYTLYTK
jgi:hypothetical protein